MVQSCDIGVYADVGDVVLGIKTSGDSAILHITPDAAFELSEILKLAAQAASARDPNQSPSKAVSAWIKKTMGSEHRD